MKEKEKTIREMEEKYNIYLSSNKNKKLSDWLEEENLKSLAKALRKIFKIKL